MSSALRDEVVAQLRTARKYRHLCADTLGRMADWALARHLAVKPAVKAAKRKLHQVYGAYADQVDAEAISQIVREMGGGDPRPGCAKILRHHVSSVERLDVLDVAFEAIWQRIGRPHSVMDLACGLNPFALPWMGLEKPRYYACDIDVRVAQCIADFFAAQGVNGVSECRDLLVAAPDDEADVALLLKTLPCLEQQEKDAGFRILSGIRTDRAVVSFPARSLGGHEKGMTAHYEAGMQRLAARLKWQMDAVSFPGEAFYILSR